MMSVLFLVAAVGTSLLTAALGSPDADCTSSNYVNLTEPRRLLQSGGTLCDHQLQKRWYRFTSPGGKHLSVKPRTRNSCGTNFPLFISDASFTLPPVNDYSTHSTKVCANFRTGCDWDTTIRLKRCDGFVLYELVPTPGCNMAYCTQDALKTRCALGEFEDPKTSKCIEPPPVATSVTIEKPLATANLSTFSFPCRFRLSSATSHGYIAMAAVYALFNGRLDPTAPIIVPASQGVAYIPGTRLKGHIPSQITCGVVGLWKELDSKFKSRLVQSSNSYAAKIEMYIDHEPYDSGKETLIDNRVVLWENSDPYRIILRSTIPITSDTHTDSISKARGTLLRIGLRTFIECRGCPSALTSGTRTCLTEASGVWDKKQSVTQFKKPLSFVYSRGHFDWSNRAILLQFQVESVAPLGFSIWEGVGTKPIALYSSDRDVVHGAKPNYCYCVGEMVVCEQGTTTDATRKTFHFPSNSYGLLILLHQNINVVG